MQHGLQQWQGFNVTVWGRNGQGGQTGHNACITLRLGDAISQWK